MQYPPPRGYVRYKYGQPNYIEIVKENQPITSENIASMLNVTRATLRSDLAILTMTGILDARPKVGYFYTGVSQINLLGNDIKEKKVEDMMGMPVVVKKDVSLKNADTKGIKHLLRY